MTYALHRDSRGILIPEKEEIVSAGDGIKEMVAQRDWLAESLRRENEAAAKGDSMAVLAYRLLNQAVANGRVKFRSVNFNGFGGQDG